MSVCLQLHFPQSTVPFVTFSSVSVRLSKQRDAHERGRTAKIMAVALRALLPVLVFPILLLRLLSIGLHFRRRSGGRRSVMIRSSVSIVLIPILLSAILALSNTEPAMKKNTETLLKDSSISELEELKLKIYRLESILQDNIEILNSKMLHLGEKDKMIEELGHKIEYLQEFLHHLKLQKFPDDPSDTKERVDSIKEELQLLWAESRKNNFNLHLLESKSYDAEERLESVSSRVEKMEDIVTEQWIQIQKLEQALQVTKLRTSKTHRKSKFTKCTFSKFINDVRRHRLPEVISFFKRILSGAQRCHHELQVSVKEAMERNELTATLANNEVIFFLASAMITFPIMSIWILYSSYFSL